MKIEEIIKTYGKNDYYDMNTGRIYKLSEMHYNKVMKKTRVYVEKMGVVIGQVYLEGDWENGNGE